MRCDAPGCFLLHGALALLRNPPPAAPPGHPLPLAIAHRRVAKQRGTGEEEGCERSSRAALELHVRFTWWGPRGSTWAALCACGDLVQGLQ